MDGIAPADDEPVETARAHFEDEVAGLAVRDQIERAERDVRRGGGQPFTQGSFAFGKPFHAAS